MYGGRFACAKCETFIVPGVHNLISMFRKPMPITFNRLGCFVRYCATINSSAEGKELWRSHVFSQLVTEYGRKDSLEKLFRRHPYLEQSSFNIWKAFITTLTSNGFQYQDTLKIVGTCPDVLGLAPEKLKAVLQEWKLCSKLNIGMLRFLIVNSPEFLNLDHNYITKRLLFLRSYCQSEESLVTLLFLCPSLLYENWDNVLKKIEFLEGDMVVYRSEIIQCKALAKPIQHIKLRFSVLEKCGLYTRPNQYSHKQTKREREKLNNPKLRHITDKSDVSFAKKVAKITVEEYNIYSELFEKYENELDNESDSESSESESDKEN